MRKLLACQVIPICITFLLLLFSTTSFAQKTVKGTVTAGTNNQPIIGATIMVKGTTVGTTTDGNGAFSLNVPSGGKTLVISSIGYNEVKIDIANQTSISVTMKEKTSALDEIVVTGYSSQRKKDITGAVAVVNTKELVSQPGSNVESLLQGRAAGVTIGTSGVPGAGASVRIRGFTTFNQNEPLYIVDGARVGSISDLNPNDIESMQVLKDASSAAIYGSAAANGVIIVTT